MHRFEEYRIKKGQLTSSKVEIPIDFGLIFNEDGILVLDLYVSESFNLSEFLIKIHRVDRNQNYGIECFTEDNNKLYLDTLRFSNITPHISKVKMVCYGQMKHVKINNQPEQYIDENPKLHYLELEGLKMEFNDHTKEFRERRGRPIEDLANFKRDHTYSILRFGNCSYNQLFYQATDSENIIVEFPNDSNDTLSYEKFCEIRHDYISALSFLNGATVRIRKECTGSYYSLGKIDSEIVITYSFSQLNHKKFSKYLPINNPFNISDRILRKFFDLCFDSFVDWNKKIDLNTIIYFLSNSVQTKSIDERIFIQMIAFERLTTKYAEYLGEKEEFSPSQKDFEPIKKKLFQVIDEHKLDFGDAFEIVKSKIGNLNQIKRFSTKEKMYKLIQDVKIPINPKIENLIDIVRNKTIHQGDIGSGNEGVVNYYLLDELISSTLLK